MKNGNLSNKYIKKALRRYIKPVFSTHFNYLRSTSNCISKYLVGYDYKVGFIQVTEQEKLLLNILNNS